MSNGTNESVVSVALKLVVLLLGLLAMVGFGACGLWGVVMAVSVSFSDVSALALFGISGMMGIGMAVACFLGTRALLRSLSSKRS